MPYPVLFPDTVPCTIAGSPSGSDHRGLLCFHPQRTKQAPAARDDLSQTEEKQQHERIPAASPGVSTACTAPWAKGLQHLSSSRGNAQLKGSIRNNPSLTPTVHSEGLDTLWGQTQVQHNPAAESKIRCGLGFPV